MVQCDLRCSRSKLSPGLRILNMIMIKVEQTVMMMLMVRLMVMMMMMLMVMLMLLMMVVMMLLLMMMMTRLMMAGRALTLICTLWPVACDL